jgi:ClpP class serine protease
MQKLMKDIDKANKNKSQIVAIAVSINSPGGSAVYSSIIGSKLKVLAEKKKAPYYTFAEALAASGGYWILCTGMIIIIRSCMWGKFMSSIGDHVYANKNSLVGSIGVVSMPFNMRHLFDETRIKRHSISTSDKLIEHRLDPFKEEFLAEKDVEFLHKIMDDVYRKFVDHVKIHREGKI